MKVNQPIPSNPRPIEQVTFFQDPKKSVTALRDDYKLLSTSEHLELCPCCGGMPELWRYSESDESPTAKVVMCSTAAVIGPQDGIANEGCLLYMPPNAHYRATEREAIKFWNELARAMGVLQRKNRWEHRSPLRGGNACGDPDVTVVAAPGPVTQSWVHGISMMQQSVLLAAIRGPDGLPKYGGGAKMLLRWYRRCVLLSAMDGRAITDPIEKNGGSFTGPSLDGDDDQDPWSDRMQVHVHDYLRQVDMLPHHYQMHFMHAAEIVGYKHPDQVIRMFWHRLYLRLVHDFHLWPETEEQLDDRLGDTRSGWLKRADPATTD